MTVYKIKSTVLRQKGERIEGIDKARMEKRLAAVQKYQDPKARLLCIPDAR